MADVLVEHQIRVHETDAPADPIVSQRLGVPAVVIGPDQIVLATSVAALGIPDEVPRVVLADMVPWSDLCGVPLNPLPRFALRAGFSPWPERDAGALRRCAWLAAALGLSVPGSPGEGTVIDAVLATWTCSPLEAIP